MIGCVSRLIICFNSRVPSSWLSFQLIALKRLKDISTPDFSTPSFNPDLSTLDFSTMNFPNPDFSTPDFSTMEFSGVEAWVWKVRGWNVLQPNELPYLHVFQFFPINIQLACIESFHRAQNLEQNYYVFLFHAQIYTIENILYFLNYVVFWEPN